MPNNPFLYFDIETGGLDPKENSILSISHARGDERKSLYAKPTGKISEWVAANVWEPIKGRLGGEPTSTEEEILRDFLGTLQKHRGGTVAGWNVGYVASPMTKGSKGFDIPFIMSRAEKYGIHKEFGEAFGNVNIRDIGREFSVRIAGEVSKYPELVDKDLHAQAQSFTKLVNINRATQRLNSVPEVAEWMGTPGKYGGYEVAGWKIKDIYQTMFGENISGHHLSEQDVDATRRIAEQGDISKLTGPGFVKNWNETALLNKAAASANARKVEGLGDTFYARAAARFAANDSLERGVRVAGKFARKHPIGLGVGIGLAALLAVKPLQYFSGKDDHWNSIEGLRHGGMAERKRRELTDFGSGYQGNKDYEASVKKRFGFFEKALDEYGEEVGTGHKRILIPKEALTQQQLEEVMGFVPVAIAIPEAGQENFTSFRHPEMLYHIHDHGESWSMHEDRHAASTMLIKKWMMERTGQIKQTLSNAKTSADSSVFEPFQHFAAGIPHILEEGIPGAYYYLKGQVLGGETMLDRLKQDLSPEYKKKMAQFHELKDDSWSGLKKMGRSIRNSIISGKDDAYNTIEGLRHGGMAEKSRHEHTDFGSGWVRRALSMGIPVEKVAAAANTLKPANMYKIEATLEGKKWLTGRVMGKGGMGVVSEAFEAGTGRAGIYKHIGATQRFDEGVIVQSPAFKHMGKETNATFVVDKAKQGFMDKYTVPSSRAWRKTTESLGGFGAHQEATLQKMAHQQYGSMVPEVYGEAPQGMFMEFAGKPISPNEEVKALKWMKEQWKQQLNQIPIAGQQQVTHLDPQIKNIMKKGDQYKMIDWGVATTEQLDHQTRSQGIRAYDEYIKRKGQQVTLHRNAAKMASRNAKYGGKGHNKKSGTMPLVPTQIKTKLGG